MSNVVAELVGLIGFKVDRTSLSGVTAAINKVSMAVRAIAAVNIVKGITEQFVGFAEKTVDAATHMQAMATSVGMGIEQIQGWSYVVDVAGGNINQFARGLNQAEANLRLLADGRAGKDLRATFAELGTSAEDAKKAISSHDGLDAWLKKVADRTQKMGNNARTGALLTSTFGRIGGRMIAADFAGGSERIDDLMKRRREMGELSEKDVTKLKNLRQEWRGLGQSINAMAQVVLAKLSPEMTKAIKKAEDWIAAHREMISGAIQKAFETLATVLKGIGNTIDFLSKHTWILYGAMYALGAVLAGKVVVGFVMAIDKVSGLVSKFLDLAAGAAPATAEATAGLEGMGAAASSALLPLAGYLAAIAAIAAAVYGIAEAWKTVSEEADTAHGKEEQAEQEAADNYYSQHGTYQGAPERHPNLKNNPEYTSLYNFHAGDTGPKTPSKTHLPGVRPSAPSTQAKEGPVVVPQSNVTVNVHGVKDAAQIAPKVGEAVDTANRRAAAALNRGR